MVSLESNGGFASVRSRPAARGPPGAGTCLNELRGDNKQFNLSLLTDDGFDGLNYQAIFAPAGADWQTLNLPLADFRASIRGREVSNAPALDPARIRQVGLMIAARQAGPFELHIRWLSLARPGRRATDDKGARAVPRGAQSSPRSAKYVARNMHGRTWTYLKCGVEASPPGERTQPRPFDSTYLSHILRSQPTRSRPSGWNRPPRGGASASGNTWAMA